MSRATGALMFALGYLLRVWSLHHLRRVGVVDHKRIARPRARARSGPYRWMTHPMYLGSTMMMAGMGMMALGWGGAVIGYAVVPHLRERSLRENDVMEGL